MYRLRSKYSVSQEIQYSDFRCYLLSVIIGRFTNILQIYFNATRFMMLSFCNRVRPNSWGMQVNVSDKAVKLTENHKKHEN